MPTTVPMSGFGTSAIVPKTLCYYFMQLKGKQFTPYKGTATCGSRISVPSS